MNDFLLGKSDLRLSSPDVLGQLRCPHYAHPKQLKMEDLGHVTGHHVMRSVAVKIGLYHNVFCAY